MSGHGRRLHDISDIKEILLKKRRIEGECWIWTGAKGRYGMLGCKSLGFRTQTVHRLSAMIFLGFDLRSNLQVNHKCNKTLCFNPEHLYIGTQSANIADSYRAGTRISVWEILRRQRNAANK